MYKIKARKILGLLYKRFYNSTDGATLLQLYHGQAASKYASPVWNPNTDKNVKMLENVEVWPTKDAEPEGA